MQQLVKFIDPMNILIMPIILALNSFTCSLHAANLNNMEQFTGGLQ